jgi:hypothetical protein
MKFLNNLPNRSGWAISDRSPYFYGEARKKRPPPSLDTSKLWFCDPRLNTQLESDSAWEILLKATGAEVPGGIAWVTEHFANVCVAGCSAGGHLALSAALRLRERNPAVFSKITSLRVMSPGTDPPAEAPA